MDLLHAKTFTVPCRRYHIGAPIPRLNVQRRGAPTWLPRVRAEVDPRREMRPSGVSFGSKEFTLDSCLKRLVDHLYGSLVEPRHTIGEECIEHRFADRNLVVGPRPYEVADFVGSGFPRQDQRLYSVVIRGATLRTKLSAFAWSRGASSLGRRPGRIPRVCESPDLHFAAVFVPESIRTCTRTPYRSR